MPKQELVNSLRHPGPAPVEYAGQWVAWDKTQTEIIAHGVDFHSVRAAATRAGHPDAIFQMVRRPDTIFIGPT
jgi:hypothetical protein